MAQFRNLTELQRYLEQNAMEILANSMDIERVLAEAMYDNVWKHVYDAYEPEFYERREDDNYGLADPRNFQVVDWGVKNGKAFLTFENLAQGDDILRDVFLVDTIEEGIASNWSKQTDRDGNVGAWTKPRPFVEKTIEHLKQNPQELINAIKGDFQARGMKFRKK